MSDVWAFLFSPKGLVIYAAFWTFKILFGAWLIRQVFGFMPVHLQDCMRNRWNEMKGWRR